MEVMDQKTTCTCTQEDIGLTVTSLGANGRFGTGIKE